MESRQDRPMRRLSLRLASARQEWRSQQVFDVLAERQRRRYLVSVPLCAARENPRPAAGDLIRWGSRPLGHIGCCSQGTKLPSVPKCAPSARSSHSASRAGLLAFGSSAFPRLPTPYRQGSGSCGRLTVHSGATAADSNRFPFSPSFS